MRYITIAAFLACASLIAPTAAIAEPNLLTNGDFSKATEGWWIMQDETCKAEVAAADVAGVKQALHLAISPKAGANPWDIAVMRPVEARLQKGTVAEMRAWLRSPQSCRVTALMQLGAAPYTGIAYRQVKLTPDWAEYVIRGRCGQDFEPTAASAGFQVAFDPGDIEIADVSVADLGPNASDTVPIPATNVLNLIPFVLPWDDATPSVTNVSAWLDKPAGARGFVTVRDSHLYTGDRRLRFIGANITSGAAFPEHADAEKVAARLAKFGINAVRFHHMDATWANPNIFAADARALSPEQLDRLDYFIAQLKKNGIYADLNMHVSREYPGFPKWQGMPDFFKGIDIFYPPIVDMQREYARALLTHTNPYTKTRYVDEPSVGIIEINNENGLLSEWQWGALDNMPAVYADELERQWNTWLKARYPTDEALKKAWDLTEKPVGAEMLANGNFARGDEGWVLEVNGTAKATATRTDDGPNGKPAMSLAVQAIDQEGWHVQFDQPSLKFQQGAVYTIEFDARADAKRTISLDARQAHDPWQTLWSVNLGLTPQWQHLSFPIQPNASEDNGRITFSGLGAMTGTVELANVSLKPGGGYKLKPGEALGTVRIIGHADFGGASVPMQRDWMRFLYDTESAYWTGMAKFIHQELGAKCPVVGTAVGFSPVSIQAQLEVVDDHAYWQHPSFPGTPWDGNNWFVPNTPMAGMTDGGTLPGLGLSRVVGKPFIVTEYNHPAPATHNSEAFLLAAAYAGLQDWDGFFSFAYEGDRNAWRADKINGYFDVEHHPTQMATMPAAAALFLRGDVASPAKGDFVSTTPDKGPGDVQRFGTWYNAGHLGLSGAAALQRPVGIQLDGKPAEIGTPPTGPKLVSDNGQWTWDSTKGHEGAQVNAPRSKAVIGSITGGPFVLGDVVIAPGKNLQDWAAITLTAMDGASFTAPGRILVTATGYAENTSMGWKNKAKTTVGPDWGIGPSLIEGIPATVTLPVAATRVAVWALDERGQRREQVPVTDVGGKATFEIGAKYKTLWYEAVVK
jgi:hypothetical protein